MAWTDCIRLSSTKYVHFVIGIMWNSNTRIRYQYICLWLWSRYSCRYLKVIDKMTEFCVINFKKSIHVAGRKGACRSSAISPCTWSSCRTCACRTTIHIIIYGTRHLEVMNDVAAAHSYTVYCDSRELVATRVTHIKNTY